MFSNGSYATVWNVTTDDNGRVKVELSTSRKDRESGQYTTDFSSKYVNFVSDAKAVGADLHRGDRIRIDECGVSNGYNKETQKGYTNFFVFKAEKVERRSTPESATDEDVLPF